MHTFLKKNYLLFLSVLFFLFFFFFSFHLIQNDLTFVDKTLYDFVLHYSHTICTKFFKTVTLLASSPILLIFCMVSIFVFKKNHYGICITVNLILSTFLNIVLKLSFSRPRPEDLMIIKETGYSFPSGHSMAAVSFYGFLIYLLWKTNWSKETKIVGTIGLGLVIFLVGMSRIYLGVHYGSDVLAGFCIALSYLFLYIYVLNRKVLV